MGRRRSCEFFMILIWTCSIKFLTNAVSIENGVYKDVLVSFAANIPADNAEEVLWFTQETLTSTSRVLKKAIGVSPGDVIFLVPHSWNVNTTKNTLASHSSSIADISVVVTEQDSAFGTHPYVVQYGGCGTPGLKISIPVDLSSNIEANARSLAKEWIKYRYGVFDEGGFPGDERFPLYYSTVGADISDVRVTDCTNAPLRYQYKGSDNTNCTPIIDDRTGLPKDEMCSVVPDEEDLESIESSLLYIPTLPKVEYVCGTDNRPHNSMSPSKQNALCNGKSILDVLKSSPEIRIGEISDAPSEPEFIIVKKINPRIVLAYDITTNIGDKRGETIKTSIRRFLYDLPTNSKCSFIRFPDTDEVNSPLKKIPDNMEDRLQVDTNLKFSFEIPPTNPCPQCAIKKALDILLTDDSNSPGSIILISSSNPAADEQVLTRLRSSQVCLSVVAFQGLMATFEGFRSYLEASPCGNYVEIPDSEDPLEMHELLHATLGDAVLKPDTSERTETVLTSYIRFNSNSEPFSIGPPSAKVTLWLMPKKDLYVSAIECKTTDAPEKKRTPKSTFEPPMMLALVFQSDVNEQLTCSLKYARDPVQMQVRSTSLPGKYFDFDAWFVDTTPINSQDQMPVILYAKIHLGAYPILRADVKAVVMPPEGDSVTFKLLDNGIGDPDITMNDGIYSRYFTQFTVAGKYTVQITISDNDGQAQAGAKGLERCCGSRIILQDQITVGKFERLMKTEFDAVGGRPELGYKPSRIPDLRVDSATLPRYVTLRWTAPGGEADQGKASRYVFKIFDKQEDARKNFAVKDEVLDWVSKSEFPNPEQYGTEQEANITFSETIPLNRTYYLAVMAINDKNQLGIISNIIQLILLPDIDSAAVSNSPSAGTIAGSVIGVILLLIAAVLCYLLYAKRRRKVDSHGCLKVEMEYKREPDNHQELKNQEELTQQQSNTLLSTDDEPSSNVIHRVGSFPVFLYTHDQLRDFKESDDPPLYKPNDPTKDWPSFDSQTSPRRQRLTIDSGKVSLDEFSVSCDGKEDRSTISSDMKVDRSSEDQPIFIGRSTEI